MKGIATSETLAVARNDASCSCHDTFGGFRKTVPSSANEPWSIGGDKKGKASFVA